MDHFYILFGGFVLVACQYSSLVLFKLLLLKSFTIQKKKIDNLLSQLWDFKQATNPYVRVHLYCDKIQW